MKMKQLLKFGMLGSLLLAGCAGTKPTTTGNLNNSSLQNQELITIKTKNTSPAGPYSEAKRYGNLVYTSGQIGITPSNKLAGNDIKSQTTQVMENIKAVLNAAGTDFNHVVKATCFLSDAKSFAGFNEVYVSYFNESFPARSCVVVTGLAMNALVEVEMVAVVP